MEIKKNDLLKIIDILKKNIDKNFSKKILIQKEDFYWEIDYNELYNPKKKPKNLTLGQLSDDWTELLRLAETKEEPLSYDLKRLGEILRIIKKYSKGKW